MMRSCSHPVRLRVGFPAYLGLVSALLLTSCAQEQPLIAGQEPGLQRAVASREPAVCGGDYGMLEQIDRKSVV